MERSEIDHPPHDSHLLCAMDLAIRDRIEPYLETTKFTLGDIVCDAGTAPRHAYFPEGCVLSLVTLLEDGSAIETANIGREGAFGLFATMCSCVSYNRCIVRLEGSMLRCKMDVLRSEIRENEGARDLFVSYSETLLAQVQQTVACNAVHSVNERLCRLLLMTDDRAGGNPMTYTHEVLSHMLGANRKSITLAAQSLQAAGMIRYNRGVITVVDRAKLERASCECYALVKARFDAFLTPPATADDEATLAGRNRID